MYDVIIIGAGPAGITASLYTLRKNLKTLIIYGEKSSLNKAHKIENYYGFENGIDGKELYNIGIKQAEKLGAELLKEEVINIQTEYLEINNDKRNQIFKVQTLNNEYISKVVILATGSKKYKPNIDNIEKYEGKGISYCAICDGFFYKNKDVAVIGSGDYAISEAKNLQNIAKTITILTNGKQHPEHRLKNIKIITKEIKGIKRK